MKNIVILADNSGAKIPINQNSNENHSFSHAGNDAIKVSDYKKSHSPENTICNSQPYTTNGSKLQSFNKANLRSLKHLKSTIKSSDDSGNIKFPHNEFNIEDGLRSPPGHLTSILDNYFRGAPLWKLIAPFSLRFKASSLEDMFAEFLQEQTAKNLWWSLLILSFGVLIEYSSTALSTLEFHPLLQPPHFLYTLGSLTITLTGIIISIFSCYKFFEPYLEMSIAIFGTIFSALLVFTSDHYRVARIMGYDEVQAWGRISFSDGPLLLGLSAILWASALFLPVRSICLWPICLSVSLSYQLATFLCGGPDGLRPSLLNIVLLMVLSYLALVGRRVLEAQFRLQFMEVYRTAIKIQSLEEQISEYQRPAPKTALEVLFNNLRDAYVQTEYVMSNLKNDNPELANNLATSIHNLKLSIAHLSRIDSLLSVNLQAIIGKPGENLDNQVNEFIISNFSRQLVDFLESDPFEHQRKVDLSVDPYQKQSAINLETILSQNAINSKVSPNLDGLAIDWDFKIIEIQKQSDGHALSVIGTRLLEIYIGPVLKCSPKILSNFLRSIESNYKDNKYHNSTHGADVCHSTLFLTRCLKIFDALDEIQQIGMIVASLCHDVAHPGRNNNFLITTRNSLAITYNDQSVLEQFHSAKTFSILNSSGCNFTSNLSSEQFNQFRSIVIDLILETDTSRHFESISKYRVRRQNPAFNIRHVKEDRWNTVRIAIKAADIGHSAKPWKTHLYWSIKCLEEYFKQGDEELTLGLPYSPLCNRNMAVEIPKSQVGFIQFVCLEVFNELIIVEEQSRYQCETAKTAHDLAYLKPGRSNSIQIQKSSNSITTPDSSVAPSSYLKGLTNNHDILEVKANPNLFENHFISKDKVQKSSHITHPSFSKRSSQDGCIQAHVQAQNIIHIPKENAIKLKRKPNFSSSSPPNIITGKQRIVTFDTESSERNSKDTSLERFHREFPPLVHPHAHIMNFQADCNLESQIRENCYNNLVDNKQTWESFVEPFENLTGQETSCINIMQMFYNLIENN